MNPLFGHQTDPGIREKNEDCLFANTYRLDQAADLGLFIVADGMGGHRGGENASALAVDTLVAQIEREIIEPFQAMAGQPSILEILETAFIQTNHLIWTELPGSYTTLTTAVTLANRVFIAHVGDSRAYLITEDGIQQITRDHSLVQRLIEVGDISPEEAATHPRKNVLYQAIGQEETLNVDVFTRRLPPSSRLLLCSDGLWNLVTNETILEMVTAHPDPQQACQRLVDLANERGGDDNITVMLAGPFSPPDYSSSEEPTGV